MIARHENASGAPVLCHPERRENAAVWHSLGVELLRVENAPFGASQQAKAQVLAKRAAAGSAMGLQDVCLARVIFFTSPNRSHNGRSMIAPTGVSQIVY